MNTTTNGHLDDQRCKDYFEKMAADVLNAGFGTTETDLGTTAPEIPVEVARTAAQRTHDAIAASHHAAELLRHRGDDIMNLAKMIKAECEALAIDIDTRAERFGQFVGLFSDIAHQTKEMCVAERERFSALELPTAARPTP